MAMISGKKTGEGVGWGQIEALPDISTYPLHFAALFGKPVARLSRPILSRAFGALLLITVSRIVAAWIFRILN
jgi:hypothetical protein